MTRMSDDVLQVEPRDTAAVRACIQANRRTLAGAFFEREAEITGLYVAALSRQHVLLVGPPGTAKSLLSRAWAAQWAQGAYWEGLFTRQSTEADIFCHLSVPEYLAGKHVYMFDGHAPVAHFAFADEIFKSNGGLLNAGLGWLNERIVRGFRSPLVSCIGASNEFGEDDSVAALEDRFLVRFHVPYIADKSAKIAFLRDRAGNAPLPVLQDITIAELEACQAEVSALPIDEFLFPILADLQVNLNGVGVAVSDRRLVQCLGILQAYAWLCGDSSVGPEHLEILRHILWRRPEDRPAVDAAIGAVDKGQIGEIRAVCERALEPFHQARAAFRDGAWTSETARREYLGRTGEFITAVQAAAKEIKERFGGNVPQRVKDKAAAYLGELKDAFVTARDDSKLSL